MPAEHVLRLKVRGYHCDFYGHVNNARYLEFLEEARWGYFEERVDLPAWQARHQGFVVAGINISFRRPAPEGAVLEIVSRMGELGPRFGVIHQLVRHADTGKTVAEADITFAVVDTRTGRSLPLEGEVRAPFESPGDA
jgi:thioesterase-3